MGHGRRRTAAGEGASCAPSLNVPSLAPSSCSDNLHTKTRASLSPDSRVSRVEDAHGSMDAQECHRLDTTHLRRREGNAEGKESGDGEHGPGMQ